MPDAHARLSPSAAHRWLHCTPCLLREESVPQRDTVYTREGTLAHAIGETLLKTYLGCGLDEPLEALLERVTQEGFDADEMLETVREGYVERVIAEFEAVRETDGGARLLIEQRVSVSPWARECWGTSDAIIIGNAAIHVWDYKHGKGVRVAAQDNPQMMLYALGAYEEFGCWLDEIRDVRMSICQPRVRNWCTAELGVDALLDWARNTVRPQAEKAARGEGEPCPGDWCRFCRVAARCKALADYAVKTAENAPETGLMTDGEIAETLEKLPVIETWCTGLRDYALRAIMDEGRAIPGWKVVEGVSRTRITDQDGAAKALRARGFKGKDIYAPLKLVGITELRKLLRKDFDNVLGAYVSKPPGAPTVVPESDARKAMGARDAAGIFKDIII